MRVTRDIDNLPHSKFHIANRAGAGHYTHLCNGMRLVPKDQVWWVSQGGVLVDFDVFCGHCRRIYRRVEKRFTLDIGGR